MDFARTILVATDHSAPARRAEVRAGMLGTELGVDTVEVMSVRYAKTAPIADASATGAAAFRQNAEPDWIRTLCPGMSPAAIVERANEIGADLTVVSGKRAGLFGGVLARLMNEELIRQSDRPVLLVHREPEKAYKTVLVGVDFSAESRHAARAALALAPSAHFTFLHVFRVPDEEMMLAHGVPVSTIHEYRIRAREAARLKLNSFIDALGPRRQLIARSIKHGAPGPQIHAHAKEIDADLTVVGKHGKPLFVELLLGSVTQRLIDYGDGDLLVTTSLCAGEPDMPCAA